MTPRCASLLPGVHVVVVAEGESDPVAAARRTGRVARALAPRFAVVAGGSSVFVEGASTAAIEEALAVEGQGRAGPSVAHHSLSVIYDGVDLAETASLLGLTSDELVTRHAAPDYEVLVAGFLPGFAYLGPLDPALRCARLATPRRRVAAGSVGIAGAMTGVYPFASPGGWRLVGRAVEPALFDVTRTPARRLGVGDVVRFLQIEAGDEPAARAPRVAEAPTSHTALRVLRAHPASSVQDRGRPHARVDGVPGGGAMDPEALVAANRAVGNPDGAAALECPAGRLEVEAVGAQLVSLDGAAPVMLANGAPRVFASDARAVRYLAVRGGFDVPAVFGSQSTLAVAGLGGLGRFVERGDVLPVGVDPGAALAAPAEAPAPESDLLLPLVALPPDARLAPDAVEVLCHAVFTLGPRDRMGTRLVGPAVPRASSDRALPEPVLPGMVQIPGDGAPIVLGPDAAVTGGYPVIGWLAPSDQARLARAPSGARVRFTVR